MAPTSLLGVPTLRHVTETPQTTEHGKRGPQATQLTPRQPWGSPPPSTHLDAAQRCAVHGAEVTGELLLRRW